ncbi:MAG: Asp-tRNA(Asn)/Glu-tRNA(Gln) amidotransferase subunit GatA [Candidatus Saccharibacteria bacterium]|uniref:Glutamyl-tRNA(Gln) amidotransferase subunit A n=1 Tax=Candidatus Nanosyncoccus alces TaxID=2171997 RepID=A0ABY0FLD1_9BACT|nr:Asp-tRNA(Asn)/Glu-tRNA(Gln) amidotransferase subunit GatA [Candidatus Nanosyncoccus alces]MDO4398865.1 Asp-tRNA(Asn)/Glu-tRNA(Gln) amidotransferase subunit GatA [Candidatus Saccharibacteria bacterium]RYC74541.1 Glutamyl-tRNA(Gln) amidotransferase subunit A [Candidatus Nanosyncoccus alces]
MKIANRKVTAERLVRDALEKARHFADYNIFTFLNEEGAIKKAREIDARIAKGEKVGRLAGVPYALKDNFLSTEGQTTAAAHILEGFVSPVTATAVEKLEREGAIMIGRTNMDAFAHGSSTESSYYGPTLNAHDRERVAGGSSGGSAVAVALDIVEFATGTDTGGSIRQPASFNGVYGLKPTYGTISRYGVVAMASSTDCIGFFTKTPDDMNLLMEIANGQDPKDLTTLPDYYDESEAKKIKKIGIIKDFDNTSVDSEIRNALVSKVELARSKGYEVVEIEMPALKYALAAYYIIVPAEVASNLSRYDGVRYGFRAKDTKDLDALYKNTRGEGFMPENKRRIMVGNFVLSSGFYDAYFLKAAKARTLIVKEYEKAFEKCDVLLSPVTPNPAFKLGEKTNDPVAMYLEDAMTVPLNLAGVPGLTIPAGKTKDGVALGLQLIGPRRSDKSLIEFSKELV